MRIALLGTRGIPASYSGFETCVEQLGQRLVERGHEVTVYCRSHHITYAEPTYKGMKLVKLPTIPNKYLDTLVHSFISSVHALPRRYDIALYFIAGNSPVTWIPRLVRTRTLLNVDGLDWKREKWPRIAKEYIKLAEFLATKLPSAYLTDSQVVQGYYKDRFNNTPPVIVYGSEVEKVPPGETLEKYGIRAGEYILFVGRLVPENCAHNLVEAFNKLPAELVQNRQCVIVGDAPYAEDYIADLKAKANGNPNIIFTGYVFGQGYHELGTNASIFVETSGVGGTHPALVEAMAFGSCVITHSTPENLETIGEAGLAYDGTVDDLAAKLRHLLKNPAVVTDYQGQATARAQTEYSWEAVTDAYEALFAEVLGR